MKRLSFLLTFALLLNFSAGAQILQNILNTINNSAGQSVSKEEVAKGLKEALTVGAQNASASANKTNGYFKNAAIKIPFPKEVDHVATKLKELGMSKLVTDFELSLNRAAEDAAKEAAPIFVNAITSMTIEDAIGLLKGGDNAATDFLKRKTTTQLYNAFSPHIKKSLDKVNATKYWTQITTKYNKIPLVKPVQTDLTKYTTNKALDGLFYLVGQEENKIRKDPAARISELLKKVFG